MKSLLASCSMLHFCQQVKVCCPMKNPNYNFPHEASNPLDQDYYLEILFDEIPNQISICMSEETARQAIDANWKLESLPINYHNICLLLFSNISHCYKYSWVSHWFDLFFRTLKWLLYTRVRLALNIFITRSFYLLFIYFVLLNSSWCACIYSLWLRWLVLQGS